MNIATILVLIVLAALVLFAARRLYTKGSCGECEKCSTKGAGCQGCEAVDKMVADMESSLLEKK